MLTSDLRANIISALLVAILVLNTLYNSDLGGPGSIYNTVNFLLALGILLVHGRFHPVLAFTFVWPVIFLIISVGINGSGIRFALASTMGFALLSLAPMPLNVAFLRRVIIGYLMVVLSLSAYLAATGSTLSGLVANPNFNVNPNSASLLFVWAIILTLIFARGKLRVVLTIGFGFLIVTTGSRAGFLVVGALLAGYALFSRDVAWQSLVKKRLSRKRVAWLVLVITAVAALAVTLVPASVENLISGLARIWLALGDTSEAHRLALWRTAFDASQQSLLSILFGYGITSAEELVGSGHNSYVAAFLVVGWPFLGATLVALIILFRYHIRRSETSFLVYAIPILLYGGVETVLFNGIGNIWYVFILLSLYYRSATGTVRGRMRSVSTWMNS